LRAKVVIDSERGVLLVALSFWLCVAVLCSVFIVEIAGRASQRAQAQSVADAAALAGAAGGPRAAEQIASANGAELASLETDGPSVTVRVVVDDVVAVASAERRIRPAGRG
jgi:uncharacterized membrane protein